MQSYPGQTIFITVDGTDFWVPEPKPFNPDYYSHKFNHAGLRYEIGICIVTGWIVWINGPFPCGPFPCGAWPDMLFTMMKCTSLMVGTMMVSSML